MSSSRSIVRVLFRVAGGRRRGFGHIARAINLAHAMRVPAALSIRGTDETAALARGMGARVLSSAFSRAVSVLQPTLVIVDDPDVDAAARALAMSRRRGLRVASVHDLGIAGLATDLAIDGSIVRHGHLPAAATLTGTRYSILDPRLTDLRAQRTRRGDAHGHHVLVSLGGAPRRALAWRIARAVLAAHPSARVTVAAGFAGSALTAPDGAGADAARTDTATADTATADAATANAAGATGRSNSSPRTGVRALRAPSALRPTLARTDVAVLAGGVTLYEAAALGVPAVALAVVPAQIPTVRAFAARRAALDAGRRIGGRGESPTVTAHNVVQLVSRLLDDAALRRRMGQRGRGLVDGRGAQRVAAALHSMVNAS